VTITNTGGDPLAFGTIVNTDPAHFTVSQPSPSILHQGESRTVPVTFATKTAGSFSATVTIPMVNPGVPGVTLTLSAQTVRQTIAVGPNHLKFGKIAVGATPPALVATVTNTSTAPLSLDRVTSDDPAFDIVDVDRSVVPPGGTAAFTVVFRAAAAGNYQTRIAVTIAGSASADAEIKASGMVEMPKKK
jgi:hypothetical protein